MFKQMFKLIGEIHPSTYFIAFVGMVIMLLSVDWVSPFFGWWLVLIAIANERHLTMRAVDGVVRTPENDVYKIEWVDADTVRITPRN